MAKEDHRVFEVENASCDEACDAFSFDVSPPGLRHDRLECLLNQWNIFEICFEREWRSKPSPRKSASGEDLGNGPKLVVVIESRWPKNKAACQDLRLRVSPTRALRAGELVTWPSARSDLGPSLWFALDEPKAALRDREAERKCTGRKLLTVSAMARKPKQGLFRDLVADMPAAATSKQRSHS
jgi:hypothetical protein